jgi:hypothetical protein
MVKYRLVFPLNIILSLRKLFSLLDYNVDRQTCLLLEHDFLKLYLSFLLGFYQKKFYL